MIQPDRAIAVRSGQRLCAVDAHKLDDFKPYVFKDHRLRQDLVAHNHRPSPTALTFTPFAKTPSARDCSYAGTETGAWASFDAVRTGKRCSSICRQLRSTTSSFTVTI